MFEKYRGYIIRDPKSRQSGIFKKTAVRSCIQIIKQEVDKRKTVHEIYYIKANVNGRNKAIATAFEWIDRQELKGSPVVIKKTDEYLQRWNVNPGDHGIIRHIRNKKSYEVKLGDGKIFTFRPDELEILNQTTI